MLVSETEYKHQVETDIRPFHDVLLGLFFITVGMSLDWHTVVERWRLVAVLLVVPLLFKLGLVTVLARVLGATSGVSLRTGLYLAQAGEFGFVLLALAQDRNLLPPWLATRCWRRWCCRCWPRLSSSCTATPSCESWWPATGCSSRCR
ncbi:Glutathione-regulated potassium-efflux system protein KefC [compost metagenome]